MSDTKKLQIISEDQRSKISFSLKEHYRNNPKKKKILPELIRYRLDCKFKFNIYDFPNKFDIKLIETFGWYSPKNKNNNLNGISRDHMVSVMFGFENKIDPEIISHPANCQLLRHNDNVSKGKKNKITVEDLIERIKNWNNGSTEYNIE